jgi:site-specific recombinase XerD
MLTRFLGLRYDLPQYWWLSLKQAQALLNAPDITTMKGLRARAIMAALLGCALRRSEVAALTMNHATPKQCLVTYIQ